MSNANTVRIYAPSGALIEAPAAGRFPGAVPVLVQKPGHYGLMRWRFVAWVTAAQARQFTDGVRGCIADA